MVKQRVIIVYMVFGIGYLFYSHSFGIHMYHDYDEQIDSLQLMAFLRDASMFMWLHLIWNCVHL